MKRFSPSGLTTLHSRPPLERMMRMHERIRAGRYPNCRKLADELEVSSKTVQRDIDFMRYRLGLPIEYDQLHFGFYYTEPVASFPNIEISEGELIALYIGQKALTQYKGTAFEAPLSTAFRKISDGLRDTISMTWTDLDSAISFRTTGRSTTDVHLFEQLSHALFKHLEVRFEYKKPAGNRYEQRHVQPYHLGCIENLWYLFAFDVDRQQLRTFALPRIRDVRVSKTKFKRPPDFSIGKFLGESFGVFSKPTKTRYAVRIRFDDFAAPRIQERQWHPSQKIRPLKNGAIELSLTLGNLEEIERWILSWSTHAQVLSPPELKTRIAKTIHALAANYRTDNPR
ncbi:MAG TPA: WYL domain-containing transcriptional regulator [Chthoniobacterales bacterium]|nr:WYL domain-containing transcriptional regulator [Chthoniobacterales bacterium]